MAHVKGSGKVSQQSQQKRSGKRLGLKKSGGETIQVGQIIIRQRGIKYKPGKGVGMGRDHTIFAMHDGTVQFGQKHGKTVVNVVAT
ncbi:50S ribosomal protein L27 [Patescibacteria group bacterium]|nr:50S ribosomal protein L27 [Patescibacteria group bacterium]MBU1967116.1 50S ribosomal protein L27 [Patescibacteria group bacterium]MBU2543493.1 50S ribosomal protein L27 [Patescibacteria group bacterium]